MFTLVVTCSVMVSHNGHCGDQMYVSSDVVIVVTVVVTDVVSHSGHFHGYCDGQL